MTRQTVLVEGNQLALCRQGIGTPVIFVHGKLCDHQDGLALAEQLAGDHEVILQDVRWHGESEGPHSDGALADGFMQEDFGMADSAVDVVGVIKALDGPTIPIGHSMGGVVVLKAARLAPELVKRVLMIDFRWAFNTATDTDIDGIPSLSTDDGIPSLLTDAFVARRATMDNLRRNVAPDVVIGETPTQAVAAESMGSLITSPGQELCRECPVPVYAVVADRHWPPMDAATEQTRDLAAKCIAGTGHWVMVEQPELVAKSAHRFEAGLV